MKTPLYKFILKNKLLMTLKELIVYLIENSNPSNIDCDVYYNYIDEYGDNYFDSVEPYNIDFSNNEQVKFIINKEDI